MLQITEAMRNSTENIYQQKVNQVIGYISTNLHLPLQLDVIADKINVSFHRLLCKWFFMDVGTGE